MINCKEIINDVNFLYQTLSFDRDYKLHLKEEKLNQYEDYNKAKNALSSAIYDLNKVEFDGDEKLAKTLSAKVDKLKAELEKIKQSKGVDVPYVCPICKDTGMVDNQHCACYYKNITIACYKELGLTPPTLFTFEQSSLSSDNQVNSYYAKLLTYANNFAKQSKNLVFTGKTGTGKTCLAQSVTSKIIDNKFTALFITSTALNNIWIDNMYANLKVAKLSDDILQTCDFLVIDDLGAEKIINKITLENLLNLISIRLQNKKPFLITTNLTINELKDRYGERLFSRIASSNSVILNFEGKDLRLNKK